MAYNIIIGRTRADREIFGEKGTIFLGKHYVKMGETVSLSNKVLMDVAKTHVILVSGKRGCLTGDTLVFTSNGYKKIEEFDEKKDRIYSFDKKKEKFELEKAKLLKYAIDEELFNIKMSDGQELIATSEHPFLVKSNKKYSWKIASELTKEDKIVSILKLPKTQARGTIGRKLARLLGFILADGTLFVQKGRFKDGRGYWYNGTKKRLRIINAQEEVLVCAKEDLESYFKIKAKRYERKDSNCEVIETTQQKVVNRFIGLGVPVGKKSDKIRVPKTIFLSPPVVMVEFLKALFSCDGFVSKEGANLEYYSNSLNFLKDLQLLLGYFSIHSKIREKKVTCNGKKFLSYALSIWDYQSIKNFEDHIGFFSNEKRNRLKKRKFWRMSRRKKTQYISNELFFESIKEIETKKTKTTVFDLRVRKNHSFIANGVISHNSGKSYSLSVIAEEMARMPEEISKNLSIIMFDTMGVFWTMKYPNERDEKLLEKWNLKPESMKINLYVPEGYFNRYKERNLPADYSFSIKTSELDAGDWANVFNINVTDPIGVLIERVIEDLKDELGDGYDLDDIINKIRKNKKVLESVRDAAENRFVNAKRWGLFSSEGTEISDLVKRGEVTVIDTSAYTQVSGAWSIKNLVLGMVARKLLAERIVSRRLEELENIETSQRYLIDVGRELEKPMIWLFIDEVHEALPRDGITPATDALVQLLREGRQPGISLVLATQQPGEIHKDVLTQSDIVLSHRLTAKKDIDALNEMMQSYLLAEIQDYMNGLPGEKGSAIILDDNSERIYPMRVRPKLSWHGGEAPSAIKFSKKEELTGL
ncbi:MAG: LAGLIDADG family homing endonuclease [Nanoarchaeota archaeon]